MIPVNRLISLDSHSLLNIHKKLPKFIYSCLHGPYFAHTNGWKHAINLLHTSIYKEIHEIKGRPSMEKGRWVSFSSKRAVMLPKKSVPLACLFQVGESRELWVEWIS
ncbi:hypothetical protein SAY87_023144 [Trapa incisa]|uniref:Uncharacterized protein n=1 Tax=Trapa incisa TaxID=236973 RepID=A0AAN7K8Y8_9MYRT|nr:hypothetical protein SAY87_023144 [Trapa incisa]